MNKDWSKVNEWFLRAGDGSVWLFKPPEKISEINNGPNDWRIVATSAMLESGLKLEIARLLDSGEPYLSRAIKIAKSLGGIKPEAIPHVVGGVLTLGSLVSYSLSLGSIEYIVQTLSLLLDEEPRTLLSNVRETWLEDEEPGLPLISNWDSMCASIARGFELRHEIAHEPPTLISRASDCETTKFRDGACMLLSSFHWYCCTAKFGKPARTTSGLVQLAAGDLEVAQASLHKSQTEFEKKFDLPTNYLSPILKKFDELANDFVAAATQAEDQYGATMWRPIRVSMKARLVKALSNFLASG